MNMEQQIVIHRIEQAFQVIQALMVTAVGMEVIRALQVAMALVMEDMATVMEDMGATALMGEHMEGQVTTGKLLSWKLKYYKKS